MKAVHVASSALHGAEIHERLGLIVEIFTKSVLCFHKDVYGHDCALGASFSFICISSLSGTAEPH